MIRIRGLTRVHRDRQGREVRANDGIDLDVPDGRVFGLLGPNGAGKTTLVHQVLGLVKPTSGTLHVDGTDVVADPDRVKESAGFLPQTPLAMDLIEVRRALHYTGRLRGQSEPDARRQTADLLGRLGLEDSADRYLHQLSGGMRRMANLGMALMGRPSLLVLDEPTNELDPRHRRLVWDLVAEESERHGTTVLLVTHNLLEAEQAVHEVAVLRGGRLIATGTPDELHRRLDLRPRMELTVRPDAPLTPAELDRLGPFGAVERGPRPGTWTVHAGAGAAPAVLGIVTSGHAPERVEEFRLARPTLEQVYLGLDDGREAAPPPGAAAPGPVPAPPPAPPPVPAPARPAGERLRRAATALKFLWLEQILQVRTTWVWTAVVGVLMPMAMVFGLPRISGRVPDHDTLVTVIGGAAVFSATTQGFSALAMGIGIMKADGRMLYYASLPLSRTSFVAAIVLSRLLLALPGLCAPLVAGVLLYDDTLVPSPLLLLVLPLAALSLAALGIAVGSALERVETIGMVTNLVTFVLLLASPVLVAPDALPGPVRAFGMLLPPTYAADAVRRAIDGNTGAPVAFDLAVLAVATAVGFLATARWIRWRTA
ncbi:ABC transporter ATP-binding protein/permease [Streptomyces sp. NBC_00091]|uniref:ABC transporter ATP-binding protein/permease n=1 Tax=Streptomyces sp. NBC_00091 TaxID=2975648 RepID=UPI0022511076|nr:ABC transporter ATP-binding protein/permease [Streptomyces sp. NBC_00091]MCX5381002.1 ABC transporter ATP-binding protein/permease [Streptomyces sp. NBC_00091]